MSTSKSREGVAHGHMPGLDGLRGLAILLVFANHALRGLPYATPGEEWVHRLANAGWIGVDLFFVLSGFLITGILLDTKSNPGYFRTFYGRRVLRILPLYLTFVVILLWILPSLPFMNAATAEGLRQGGAWYWTHSVNFMIALHGWKYGTWRSSHLWSLSVEEQFYLCWPAVVFALSRRGLIRTAVAVTAGVWILRAAFVSFGVLSWTSIYVLLPTRMDTLAIGALLAALARGSGVWFQSRRWIAPAVVATLVLMFVFHRDSLAASGPLTQIAGYPALAVLAGAAIVAAATASPGSFAEYLSTNSVLRFFGRYSYGLYVWHVLVIAVVSRYVLAPENIGVIGGSRVPEHLLFTAVALAISTSVALLSWYVIESPFLALKAYVPYATRGKGQHKANAARLSA